VAILNHIFPKSIRVEAQLPEKAWPVFADATQLSQVLMNLCVNARDAMPEGGMLTIRLAKAMLQKDDPRLPIDAKPGPYVIIGVADTGTGIAPEVIDMVFDPFFSTKGPGRGSGLGLSTAVGIVQGHGGFINVSSELGAGSQFDVYLPAASAQFTEQSRERQMAAPAGDGALILLVDDEALIRETAAAILQRRGYQVLAASDGVEALELYRQRRPEIRAVILDMMLPGIDGPSVMEEFERLDPNLPLIVSSGLPVRGRVADRISARRGAFLPKPYSDEQLLAAVADAVKKQAE
jgi:CheY-like chemotaxis protein